MAEGQAQGERGTTVLRVVDVLDHPHGGRVARVRVQNGSMPSTKSLRGATLQAKGPNGQERRIRVLGFSLTGGKVSDARIKETGRVDLHIEEEGEGPPIDLTWRLTPV